MKQNTIDYIIVLLGLAYKILETAFMLFVIFYSIYFLYKGIGFFEAATEYLRRH